MTAPQKRPTIFALWLILASVFGWWAAFKLTLEKLKVLENPDAHLSCDFSVMIQCGANLNSWQGEVFGFPNPIIGLTGWIAPLVVGVALLAGARFARWFWALFGVGMLGAFVFVCWLISQSIYELGTLCPWCMATWAVTIPSFFATLFHLMRNGTVSRSPKVRRVGEQMLWWTPLITVLAYAAIVTMAQLRGLDLIGELITRFF